MSMELRSTGGLPARRKIESTLGHQHIVDSNVFVESSPVGEIWLSGVHYPNQASIWTNAAILHNEDVYPQDPGDVRYKYLPAVVLHELGHALGLDDLPGQVGYLMGKPDTRTSIPTVDIEYLKQIYTTHTD